MTRCPGLASVAGCAAPPAIDGTWDGSHDWSSAAAAPEDAPHAAGAARDLVGLLLALLGLLRDVMELQAIRRMDEGTLAPPEIERLGRTLEASRMALDDVATAFGITRETMSEALARMIRLSDDGPSTGTETSEFAGMVNGEGH